jgi:universal stress protein E
MRHFHNLLYISHGIADESEGLKQALSLARNNEARLKVLIISSQFPEEFPGYRKKYEESLLARTKASIKLTMEAIKLEVGSLDISIDSVKDKRPSIKIIQHVLQHSHDLVIKEPEVTDGKSGFKSVDMDLLRKCPVPVWLCRPIEHAREQIKVAVAIDPDSQESEARALSKRMLELSSSLADSCSGELHIVSCWDYELEKYLSGNPWIKMSDDVLKETVDKTNKSHYAELQKLIDATDISSTRHHVHHLRGKPDELIPLFAGEKNIDILIMGTLGRTGIPGFMIGNTAENVVQKLSCSLMALKPQGFRSPVKAY